MPRVFGMVSTRASGDYTAAALESFLRCTPLSDEDSLLLIDNDGAYNHPTDSSNPLEIVVNPRPRSFAENANTILQRAHVRGADAYILNNDIIFTPDWLGPMTNPVAAVMTPTCNQNFQYRTEQLELKPVMTLADYRRGASQLPAVLAEHRARHAHYTEAYKTNFFCVKVPPDVYRRVGLFDRRFGMAGGEDDDYCIRTYLHGFRVVVAEESYLIHFGGRSTWSGPETREQWEARERRFIQIFRQKWGQRLSRFLLYRDAACLSADPALQAVQQQGGIAALFTEMARRDGIRVGNVLDQHHSTDFP